VSDFPREPPTRRGRSEQSARSPDRLDHPVGDRRRMPAAQASSTKPPRMSVTVAARVGGGKGLRRLRASWGDLARLAVVLGLLASAVAAVRLAGLRVRAWLRADTKRCEARLRADEFSLLRKAIARDHTLGSGIVVSVTLEGASVCAARERVAQAGGPAE
jgi:hypothetical protein